jgi:DNA helicase-2/ATP-dependent DNA helicase PcrA
MYPQEGKYHYDGHRKCNIVFNPAQTMQNNGLCPVCGSPLTLGVAHRIAELADRDNPLDRPIHKEFKYIIPLKEILAEIYQLKPESQKVNKIYFENIKKLGSELDILLNIDTNIIKNNCGEFLTSAIERIRNNML